jgi:hypothetical protein
MLWFYLVTYCIHTSSFSICADKSLLTISGLGALGAGGCSKSDTCERHLKNNNKTTCTPRLYGYIEKDMYNA